MTRRKAGLFGARLVQAVRVVSFFHRADAIESSRHFGKIALQIA